MRTALLAGTIALLAGCVQTAPPSAPQPVPQQPAPIPPIAPPPAPSYAPAPVSVEGNWTIVAARVGGVLQGNPGPASAGIRFGPAREFNANLGCNSATGPYTQIGNNIDFGAIAVTSRQCVAPAPLEGAILQALDTAQRVAATPGGGVDLLDANRQPLLRLTR